MFAEFNYLCAYCRAELVVSPLAFGRWASPALEYDVDHVVPKVLGGARNFTNYVPACPRCNRSKGGRPLGVWLPPDER